ncbi:SDR family NAD(P)-dependent oxidoreductase [Litoribacter ruber]|uniref:SDR family NAD(P)-dependent oxidoreductase n=1 Tax=Litoribacter ruber TaxID=702568 RepID=A0AAP2CIP7_9BACT|nr:MULTISPECIES: SDR family NAD(P)-dependent oxidoreductase [Litoribacter]MBS9524912.1 SDR family NAD(P)-dependent oxidoreductase [Litoribacter alkaliphilus]MBT0811927.1 SDR family NAD(P)-dependent oxidoreductase [Litoribacter ruber]
MENLIIITGCSQGLGKALTALYCQDGRNRVVGVSRTGLTLGFANFENLKIDLSDLQMVKSNLDKIFPRGDFDNLVLVNNAGWIGEIRHFGNLSADAISQIHQINTVAPAILMNEFVKRYKDSPSRKTVVNISSGAAAKNIDGWSGYSSSKAALNRYTEIAEEESEMSNWGIKFYALSPGIIDTGMQQDIRSAKAEEFSRVEAFRGFKENEELASPEEVAEKVKYLIDNRDNFKEVLQDVRQF